MSVPEQVRTARINTVAVILCETGAPWLGIRCGESFDDMTGEWRFREKDYYTDVSFPLLEGDRLFMIPPDALEQFEVKQ